jgi:predicted nucleotidyltransferase
MHIYAFGSLCRGEVGFGSDVDMLAAVEGHDPRFDPDVFSIYSYKRIHEIWKEGNPFAWHLASEARLIFASDKKNFLRELGLPAEYRKCVEDCRKFASLYAQAIEALKQDDSSKVFELSNIFLAVRNFATCFSLGTSNTPNFSRHSAKNLGERSLNVSEQCYGLLERSRILSTRAVGPVVASGEVDACFDEICEISSWMDKLLDEIHANERV